MKLIHCADFHLDSAMTSLADPAAARKRRGEILRNFERMVEFAAQEDVQAILIAGDLFDSPVCSELSRHTLLRCISDNPGIAFFCIRGNHDERLDMNGLFDSPPNLILFGREWSCYEHGEVAIYGAELASGRELSYDGLCPDPDKINIVMLHGMICEGSAGVEYPIDLSRLRDRSIDYLALGHIHSHREGRLDDRGIYCYPGCPEGRGFDECDGGHGIILLEAAPQHGSLSHRFVPFEKRRLFSVTADVTGCMTTVEMISRASDALAEAGCEPSSLVRLALCGELDAECEKDISYISSVLEEGYFFFRISDETRIKINMDDYLLDRSLRGEFVRTVFADPSLSDEDKAAVARFGIMALAGEEAD